LEFIKTNFDQEEERNYIMQVICEATQSTDENSQQQAFECLVKIMNLYYKHMAVYMQKALFGVINALKLVDCLWNEK
jgi:importin subunit beta-1